MTELNRRLRERQTDNDAVIKRHVPCGEIAW
jgi:hypothetical protein